MNDQIYVIEPGTFEEYSELIDIFQQRMKDQNCPGHVTMSDEREKGVAGVRRFVAYKEKLIVGWMTLKSLPAELKIEGICVAPKSGGAGEVLINVAVTCSLREGKGGAVILTNMSNGTGDALYTEMGFKYYDTNKMRFNIDWRAEMNDEGKRSWELQKVGTRPTKSGKQIEVLQFRKYRKERQS